ncbi:hypothetical protein B2J86_06265 [Acidovorax sp. SRB_14]|uniref:hypothetical protein n=1 Tax=unclassified Acidovorax TaxID=2684926 RepID=UPI00145D2F5B|nr:MULTISPECIES: hypothetical protein [unclassified Acidovorax]NMM78513.1 hypothetical protein [Acidovorax sp. SRB_24]NMM80536.1 hypothetical protein [Acidovorax sp. SRB_14]
MDDDNQIFVPPSFMAAYSDARGRLRESADVVRARYELCEDLANHLVEQAQTLYHVQAPSESEILRRIHAGLSGGESGIPPGEATWIVVRLAELLAWPCPDLPAADA